MSPPRIVVPFLLLAAAGCASTRVSSRDRMQVQLSVVGEPRQLAMSLYVAPFFRDGSRRLLSAEPPEETELLVTPRNEPIDPGPVQEILPAGTPVRVTAVEFPTAWNSFWRPLMTPRDRVWLELAVAGRPLPPVFVVMLPPDPASGDDVTKAMERVLTAKDVSHEVGAMSEADKRAVATKKLEAGLTLRAIELALGPPNLRKIHGDGTSVAEEWTWTGNAGPRTAYLKDGVVERVELPAKAPAP